MSGLQVWIEQDECVSAGRCTAAAPGFFAFDSDELATVDPTATRPDDEALIRIARACPNRAIHITDDGIELDI